MRLLSSNSDGSFALTTFPSNDVPSYAILSHTWEADDQEVTFHDLVNCLGRNKNGYRKIQFCGEQAAKDGLQYFWVDTCCIDKSSSAELSEAINSMYRWYENSDLCYVYLGDYFEGVIRPSTFGKCKWFTRGWTLQELLAPPHVIFWNGDWKRLGTKQSLSDDIAHITGIPSNVLLGSSPLHCNVAQRLSWAAQRHTTQPEDIAYCLLGFFDVHLTPIYGEGQVRAFARLQEAILKRWNDQTLFMWIPSHDPRNFGLLATSAKPFCRHKSCFMWLIPWPEMRALPAEYDFYGFLQPARPNSSPHSVQIGTYSQPTDHLSNSSSNQSHFAPTLGPRGVQLSFFISEFSYPEVEEKIGTGMIAAHLDVHVDAGPLAGQRVLLPLVPDISLGAKSQIMSMRGEYSRVTPDPGIDFISPYVVSPQPCPPSRLAISVSQLDPIPEHAGMVNFVFQHFHATIRPVGLSVPNYTEVPHSTPFTLLCQGGILSFVHTSGHSWSQGNDCGAQPFLLSFGVHGRRAIPWCHIVSSDGERLPQSHLQDPPKALFEAHRAVSARFKNTCFRRLPCGHTASVIAKGNSPGMERETFMVDVTVFEDLDEVNPVSQLYQDYIGKKREEGEFSGRSGGGRRGYN